jgi:biopolymer transport protein ExbD
MSRRHKRKRPQEEVSLNLAAMLDMAFQLLAFFILTFKPNPVEGQINLNLPPPVPILEQKEQQEAPDDGTGQAAAKTLTITIYAAPNGQVASMTVGLAKLFDGPLDGGRIRQIDRRLKDVFAIEGTFDQVLLRVGKTLNYGELMRVIDVCTKQKMADGKLVNKISFVELGEK